MPFEAYNSAKAVAYGDSITYGVYTSETDTCPKTMVDKKWIDLVCEHFGIELIANYSQSGISVSATSPVLSDYALIRQYSKMEKADIIFLACGTNDFGTDVTLGDKNDRKDTSFYGALDLLCSSLKEKYPESRVIYITPIGRQDQKSNKLGYSLDEYRRAIQEIAGERYGFTVINGEEIGFDGEEPDLRKKYMRDGTHPDPGGHKVYAAGVISQLLRSK